MAGEYTSEDEIFSKELLKKDIPCEVTEKEFSLYTDDRAVDKLQKIAFIIITL
jgi:hypothetical protein